MIAFMKTRHRTWQTIGILAGLCISTAVYYYTRYDPVRLAAWEKVTPRISQVEEESNQDVKRSVAQIKEFFAERRRGARPFATEVLSLSGKWAYVKDYYEEGSHNRFLEESFVRNIFSPEDLKALVDSAVSTCISKLEGRENQLLVDIRADLNDGDMAAPERLPALHDEAAFRLQYQAMLEQVIPIVSKDVGSTVSREVVSFIGSEIATQIIMEISTALAVRLGVSGGVLGAGASSGVVTFGIGLVAGILVDMALDWVIRQAGYDPEGEIAAKVIQTLDRLEANILDGPKASDFPNYDPNNHPLGDPQFRYLIPPRGGPYLEESESHELFLRFRAAQAKQEQAKAAHEAPGSLGLQNQLSRLNTVRSRLREAALKRLILEGGAQ